MINFFKRLLGLSEHQKQPRPSPQPSTSRPGNSRGPSAVPEPTTGDQISRPTRNGEMTGYEPKVLREYHAPISINAKGIAGLGLFDSHFSKQSVYSGQLGEVGFYKVLCKENLIDNASSFWSVAMPGNQGVAVPDARFKTDVDCVIVQGNVMYLFDLKYYSSGDVTWHSSDEQWLLCRDNATGKQVGKPRKMSRNMAMAQERFPKIFPNHRVVSYVVLIPTNAGIGKVAPGTSWPGDIPLITLNDAISMIRSGAPVLADPATAGALAGLVQD